MSETTTIKVSMETRDALKDIGRMGESYDALIRRLIDYCLKAEERKAAIPIQDLRDIEKNVED